MTKYNIEHKGVTCTAANWEAEPFKFVLIYNGCPYVYEQKRYISQSADTDHIRCVIEQFLEDVEKENNGWLSVKDRLPERNGRYLTHCSIEGQSLICILYYCKVGGFNESTVTHWRPLPDAPYMIYSEDTE